MKVGDLVKVTYDTNKDRTGIILRMVSDKSWGEVAHVIWNSTPVGLSQTGAVWVKTLEIISESR